MTAGGRCEPGRPPAPESEGRLTRDVAVPLAMSPGTPVPPEHIREIGKGLPIRTNDVGPTSGVFNGQSVRSGLDRSSVADLRPVTSHGWPDTLTRHMESHVAARMRREGIAEGEVVSNNIVCGNRGYDNNWPMTCENYLPSILPRDARLTVWATPDGGATWWTKTYIGTGEGIRP